MARRTAVPRDGSADNAATTTTTDEAESDGSAAATSASDDWYSDVPQDGTPSPAGPRVGGRKRKGGGKKAATTPRKGSGGGGGRTLNARANTIRDELETQLLMIAQLWSFRDPQCASVLHEQAQPIATFWADRAKKSARWAGAIENVMGGGAIIGGLMAHLPIIVAIAMHHGPNAPRPDAAMQPGSTAVPGFGGLFAGNGSTTPPAEGEGETDEFLGAPRGSQVTGAPHTTPPAG